MILFCEECGEKNDLDGPSLLNGRVVFKCRACGYDNAYSLGPAREEVSAAPRSGILKRICCFPDVVGLFLYHTQGGVLDNHMPKILTRADVEALGRAFVHTYAGGGALYSDIQGLCVVMADKYFAVHMVRKDLFVVIVTKRPCLPDGVLKCVADLSNNNA